MSFHIDVNTSLSAVMAMGSQGKVRADEFAELAEPARKRIVELVEDVSTFGDDKPGTTMRANHPKSDGINAVYANHTGLSESAAQIWLNIRQVMALYEDAMRRSKEDIDGVEI